MKCVFCKDSIYPIRYEPKWDVYCCSGCVEKLDRNFLEEFRKRFGSEGKL